MLQKQDMIKKSLLIKNMVLNMMGFALEMRSVSTIRFLRSVGINFESLLGGNRNTKKSGGILCSAPEVKYAFIKDHMLNFSVGKMCQMLSIGRSSY